VPFWLVLTQQAIENTFWLKRALLASFASAEEVKQGSLLHAGLSNSEGLKGLVRVVEYAGVRLSVAKCLRFGESRASLSSPCGASCFFSDWLKLP